LVSGFTLIELLVVVAIIAVLAGMLIPAVSAARAVSQSSSCQNNLRQFGMGFQQYAQTYGYLCSGAYDWSRDGRVDKIGWVADLNNGGYANPGKMKCASNPSKFSEKWNDIYADSGKSTTAGDGTLPDEEAETKLTLDQARKVYTDGFNTNYATSWYLVRTSMVPGYYPKDKTGETTNLDWWAANVYGLDASKLTSGNPKGKRDTIGALPLGILESASGTTTDKIPLLFDGNLGDFGEATLTYDLGKDAKTGNVGVESFSDGPLLFPANWVPSTTGTFADATGKCLGQDYVDAGTVHGRGDKKWTNVLFGDGHVKSIVDENNDTIIGYTGNSSSPGNAAELDEMFYGPITGKQRSGKL